MKHVCSAALAGEAGFVFSGRNDVRILGDGGTKFSLVNELTSKPQPVFRLRLGYRSLQRHLITALYPPLSLNATGEVHVGFAGEAYPTPCSPGLGARTTARERRKRSAARLQGGLLPDQARDCSAALAFVA